MYICFKYLPLLYMSMSYMCIDSLSPALYVCITNGVLNGEEVGAIIVIPVIIVYSNSAVSDADEDIVKCRLCIFGAPKAPLLCFQI